MNQEVRSVHEEAGRFLNRIVIIGPGQTALGIARALGKHRIDLYVVSADREPVVLTPAH